MANARVCDRCGSFYKPYDGLPFSDKKYISNALELLRSYETASEEDCHEYFDLCPQCMSEVINFLKEPKILTPGGN